MSAEPENKFDISSKVKILLQIPTSSIPPENTCLIEGLDPIEIEF